MTDRVFAATLFATFVLAVSACQQQAPADTGGGQSADVEQAPLEIREILAGPAGDRDGLRPMTPDDGIEVVVRTEGAAEGADLQVKLIALADGNVAGVQAIPLDAASGAEHVIGFDGESPWEPGRYLIEITLDGKLAGHQELDVHSEEPAPAAE